MSIVDAVYETAMGPVEIGPLDPERDRDGVLELFRTVFGIEKAPEVWDWQVLGHDHGIFYELGRSADGRVVTQFAALPSKVRIDGEDLFIGQIFDSMTHPDFRQGLKKRGLFTATKDELEKRFCGRDKLLMLEGLPNEPAYRIGQRMDITPVGRVYFHSKKVEPSSAVPQPVRVISRRKESFRISIVTEFSADLDELWARLAPRYSFIAHRDAAAMNWRYAKAPGRNYHLLELRDDSTGELLGIAVAVVGYLERPDGVLAEWFVDSERPLGAEVFLQAIEASMSEVGMSRVQAFLNFQASESRVFEDRGYVLAPTQFRMVSRSYHRETMTPERLGREWYYTLGDFDVV